MPSVESEGSDNRAYTVLFELDLALFEVPSMRKNFSPKLRNAQFQCFSVFFLALFPVFSSTLLGNITLYFSGNVEL